jgi:toxin ParE1/3/4
LRVRWRAVARRDLDHIFDYIVGRGSPLNARRFVADIEATAEAIGDLPYGYRLREEIGPGVRSKPFKSVVIIYDVPHQEYVRILRVVDARRDYVPIVREDD